MEKQKQHLRLERKHPRIETGIDCVVGLPGGVLSAARVRDISAGGLNFSCGRETIFNILPANKRTPGLVHGVVVEIRFELPQAAHAAHAITCSASLVHFERRAQDDFHVGIKFIRMDEAARARLLGYLQTVEASLAT